MNSRYTLLFIFLLFSLMGFNQTTTVPKKATQTQDITNKQKDQKNTIKVVPASNKTAIKTATKQTTSARKQQIKKAVRKTKVTRRPIRRR